MNENTQTQSQLSEEQFDTVAGGCLKCVADQAAVNVYQRHTNLYMGQSQNAGYHINDRMLYHQASEHCVGQANRILNGIQRRHQ